MDPSLADRIIQLALVRGHLSPQALEETRQELTLSDPSLRSHDGVPGLLEALIQRRRLDESLIRRLADELTGAVAPSHGTTAGGAAPTAVDVESAGSTDRVPDPAFPDRLAGWDRYRIVRLLGRGGMGEVYLAADPRVGRQVAVKFLHREDLETVERFLQEARVQARVQHEHVCRIYEVGDLTGRPYIAMQFIDGLPVGALREMLSLEEKVRIVARAADALHAAHKEGLVHRDVKPGNILVERREGGVLHPWVVDFGLARELAGSGLTVSGALLGTPAYMSPEQARGAGTEVDRRADIYSLGATLYDLLAGEPPLAGSTPLATVVRILQEDPPPLRRRAPDVPADLETVVMKCLEKDPGRRYDSAFALARDLEAVLEGEPILARPPSLRQRAVKLARRHRTLTAVVLAVAVVSLVLGTWLTAERWRLQSQARLAAEFSQEVASIEQTLRVAYFAPAHDVSAEEREAREALARLQRQAEDLGSAAGGPGQFALGRGFLRLRDYAAARRHLERAWTAGYRGGEVAAALGQTLGALYLEEMERVRRIRGREVRIARAEEATRSLRLPALRFLALARRSPIASPDYVAATLALYEERWDEALGQARRAAATTRWFYEAWILQGRILRLRAAAAGDRGDVEAARRDLDAAGKVLAEAAAMARSAPDAYLEAVFAGVQRLELEAERGGAVEAAFEAGMVACDRAAAVAPGDSRVHTQQALLLWRLAEHQSRTGVDPAPVLDQALAAARIAVRCDPNAESAWMNLGMTWWRRAEAAQARGADAGPALEEAIGALRRAVSLDPGAADAHNDLGLVYWTRGEAETEAGKDPRPSLQQALHHFEEVNRINPRLASPHANRGGICLEFGTWEVNHGLDPTAANQQGVDSCRRAIALNPDLPAAHLNMANLLLRQGSYLQQVNRDPRPLFEEAKAEYRRTMELNPRFSAGLTNVGGICQRLAYQDLLEDRDPTADLAEAVAWFRKAQAANPASYYAFVNEGVAHNVAARYRLDRGLDPSDALRQAHAALGRARAINASRSSLWREMAETELTAARWAAAAGERPEPAFAEAERLAGQSLRLNPDSADTGLTRAQVRRYRAMWERSRGRPAGLWIAKGIEDATWTFTTDPEQYEALMVRGALRLLEAQGERDPARRRELAAAAVEDLRKAMPRGPFLDHSLAPLLSVAERLAEGK